MTNAQLSLALAQVAALADAVARRDAKLAEQARRTLNELCEGWNGLQSYPPAVRDALRACNLHTTPVGPK